MARLTRLSRARVVALAELLGVERFDEVRWTRQATGVRGEDSTITSFHEESSGRLPHVEICQTIARRNSQVCDVSRTDDHRPAFLAIPVCCRAGLTLYSAV